MRGVTLVELVVALAVVGLLSGLALVGFRSLRPEPPGPWVAAADSARAAAIRTGRPADLTDTTGRRVLFLPDGRAIGRDVDPVLGEVVDGAR
jgi:prepilin-type N-terminal cleavage/methylation domain-containing protein